MDRALATYLNDHLAGARFAIALLERLRDTYPSEDQRQFASMLLGEIEADRLVLQKLVDDLDGNENMLKEATAWLAEKASRLKLRLGSGDDLALYEALETLSLGILGKLKLWQALAEVAERNSRVKEIDLAELASRAEVQHQVVESRRLAMARKLFRT
jgi:hypothetical protein